MAYSEIRAVACGLSGISELNLLVATAHSLELKVPSLI